MYLPMIGARSLRGKIAIVWRYEPQTSKGKSRWGRAGKWSREAGLIYKAKFAAAHGATAVLVVNPPSQNTDPKLRSAPGTAARSLCRHLR